MSLLPLVLKNVARNRRRTILMAAGVAVAVFVVSALLSVEGGFASLVDSAQDSMLTVREKNVACSLSGRVLDNYQAVIKAVPGVTGTSAVLRGVYSYQRKENLVAVNGVDFESFGRLKELSIVEGSKQTFVDRTDGALVGKGVATQYGWKVGQTVALEEENLTFTVAGLFTSADRSFGSSVLLHKSYLAKLKHEEGQSTFIAVQVGDPAAASAVAMSIDTSFANHLRPTKTQSERAARERELKDYREIRRMFSLMIVAIIVVSIFGTANSVSMSVRERTREVGILRSLGLRKRHVLGILVGEAVLVAAAGGAIGIALATALLATDRTLGGQVPLFVQPANILLAALVAFAIGLLGAVVPGLRATRLRIVDCLQLTD